MTMNDDFKISPPVEDEMDSRETTFLNSATHREEEAHPKKRNQNIAASTNQKTKKKSSKKEKT